MVFGALGLQSFQKLLPKSPGLRDPLVSPGKFAGCKGILNWGPEAQEMMAKKLHLPLEEQSAPQIGCQSEGTLLNGGVVHLVNRAEDFELSKISDVQEL